MSEHKQPLLQEEATVSNIVSEKTFLKSSDTTPALSRFPKTERKRFPANTQVDKFVKDHATLTEKNAQRQEQSLDLLKQNQTRNHYYHNYIPYKLTEKVEWRTLTEEGQSATEVHLYDESSRDRVVFFDGRIRQIRGVNPKDESFVVRITFYLTWLASSADVVFFEEHKEPENGKSWEPSWMPDIWIENSNEELQPELKWLNVRHGSYFDWDWNGHDILEAMDEFQPRKGIWIRAYYEGNFECTQQFDMRAYPFDCQQLCVHLLLKRPGQLNRLSLLPLPRLGNYLSFWTNYSVFGDFSVPLCTAEFGQTSAKYSRSHGVYGHSVMVIGIKVMRNWWSQIANLFSIYGLTLLSLGAFSINIDAYYADRLGYLMTLILTDVALQQSLQDKLDDMDYFTVMDYFIVYAFAFKISVIIWMALIPFYNPATVKHTDEGVAQFFVVLFSIYLVGSIVYGKYVHDREAEKLATSNAVWADDEIYSFEFEYLSSMASSRNEMRDKRIVHHAIPKPKPKVDWEETTYSNETVKPSCVRFFPCCDDD